MIWEDFNNSCEHSIDTMKSFQSHVPQTRDVEYGSMMVKMRKAQTIALMTLPHNPFLLHVLERIFH